MSKRRMVDTADDRIKRTFGFMRVGEPLNLMLTVHCRPWRGPHIKNLKGVAVSEGQIIKLLPQESANATPTQGDEQWPCSKC